MGVLNPALMLSKQALTPNNHTHTTAIRCDNLFIENTIMQPTYSVYISIASQGSCKITNLSVLSCERGCGYSTRL